MNPLKATTPQNITKGAAGLAGTAVGLAEALARVAVQAPVGIARGAVRLGAAAAGQGETAERGAVRLAGAAGDGSTDAAEPPSAPRSVPEEPRVPEEPPVDVVGEALAAEAAAERGEAPDGAGLAHEPRGASRDDEHGDAGLQRAEVEEVAAETEAALQGDVEPEEHLTEPLVDPAEAKAVAAEQATMSKAAEPDKG